MRVCLIHPGCVCGLWCTAQVVLSFESGTPVCWCFLPLKFGLQVADY